MGISGKIKQLFYNKKEKRHLMVGPAKLWKMKQAFQISFLKNQGLLPEHTLLDIGCGTLRGGIAIINYLEPGNYTGIEVRAEVLEEGKKELAEEKLTHKEPVLKAFGKFDELHFEKPFDILFAFAVLFHLEDHILDDCFRFVSKNMKAEGKFFANVNLNQTSKNNGQWQGFPVAFRSLDFYRDIASKYGLEIKEMDTLEHLGHHSNMPAGDQQMMLEITFKK